ncbi:MAG: response regulator [Theionarchaea archaeon]|nr:response regulator [Theionarchaea archaeon]
MDKKILVVDDSVFARKVLVDILGRNGYENVLEAANGSEALQIFEEERPDLVLLDLVMNKMTDGEALDGLVTLGRILEVDRNARVIVISAIGQQTVLNESLRIGAKRHIIKPIDQNTVIRDIEEVLGIEQSLPWRPTDEGE